MELAGNTILITGGTSGIGLALGKKFLALGNKVIVTGTNRGRVERAITLGLDAIRCDLTKQEQIDYLVMKIEKDYPSLNILFNNAGIQFNYEFDDNIVPLEKIQNEFEVNVIGQMVLTHLLLPTLTNSKKSCIINTTSALGMFPKSDGLVYSATKAAMRNFTMGLRYSLKTTNISVIECMPPVTDTAMTSTRNEKKMGADKFVEIILPQLKAEKSLATVTSLRVFKWISVFFPQMAHKILSK